MECFENIIGITRNDCDCFSEVFTPEENKSTSGLYMDEYPQAPVSLTAVKSIQECGKDLLTLFKRARANAISEFKKDLYKSIGTMFKPRFASYAGLIGKANGSIDLGVSKNIAGVVLTCKRIKGASITVNGIVALFNQTKDFEVRVYKRRVGENTFELVKTLANISAEANMKKENVLAEKLVLPLIDETEKTIEYYFAYDVSGFLPKDTPISCGCGVAEINLKSFVEAKGFAADEIGQPYSKTNYSYGIVLNVETKCFSDDMICLAMQSNDFVKQAIEWAILKKAVANLIDEILHSPVISRHSEAKREQMFYDKSSVNKEYRSDIQWIVENMPIAQTGCFVCDSQKDPFQIGGIKL